jgi:polyisoprenoid-binding protein YceI
MRLLSSPVAAVAAAAALIATTSGAPAFAAPLTVDLAKSEIAFVSKQMGVPVEGKFRRFTVELDFDPKKPEAGRVKLDIDTGSIDAGSAEADAEVIRKPWFNVAQFPKATFVSQTVKALGGERYSVTGPMTAKGRTVNVTAPFTVKVAGASQVFSGVFVIKRNDFGIGDGPWNDPDTVADEVQVKFRITTAVAK